MERKIIDTFKASSGNIKKVYAPDNRNFSHKALAKHLHYEITYKLGIGEDTLSGEYRGITDSRLSILLYCDRVEKVIPIQNIISCRLAK